MVHCRFGLQCARVAAPSICCPLGAFSVPFAVHSPSCQLNSQFVWLRQFAWFFIRLAASSIHEFSAALPAWFEIRSVCYSFESQSLRFAVRSHRRPFDALPVRRVRSIRCPSSSPSTRFAVHSVLERFAPLSIQFVIDSARYSFGSLSVRFPFVRFAVRPVRVSCASLSHHVAGYLDYCVFGSLSVSFAARSDRCTFGSLFLRFAVHTNRYPLDSLSIRFAGHWVRCPFGSPSIHFINDLQVVYEMGLLPLRTRLRSFS